MPGYNVEVFVHEEGEENVQKIVWVANYTDAATAIDTAGRRAIGIAKYMKDTGAGINNLGGVSYDKTKVFEKRVTDVNSLSQRVLSGTTDTVGCGAILSLVVCSNRLTGVR